MKNIPLPAGLRYTPLTKKALALCWVAHKDQQDKSGLPYFIHPLHLAEQMDTEEAICTALLHDVLEDSPLTLSDLRQAGFPPAVLQALSLLCHHPDTPYLDYIAALRGDPLARRVKLADLARREKYRRAQALLLAAEP